MVLDSKNQTRALGDIDSTTLPVTNHKVIAQQLYPAILAKATKHNGQSDPGLAVFSSIHHLVPDTPQEIDQSCKLLKLQLGNFRNIL